LLPSPRFDWSPCPSCPQKLSPQHLTVASSCQELQVRLLTDPCLPPARCVSALPPIHLTLVFRIGIWPPAYRLTILSNTHPSSLTTSDPQTPLTAPSQERNASQTNHAPALESSHPHPLLKTLHQINQWRPDYALGLSHNHRESICTFKLLPSRSAGAYQQRARVPPSSGDRDSRPPRPKIDRSKVRPHLCVRAALSATNPIPPPYRHNRGWVALDTHRRYRRRGSTCRPARAPRSRCSPST
jgi:hypothetical protein